jgi:protein-S-isoprenylcysteine O-methyltransferase Ste14
VKDLAQSNAMFSGNQYGGFMKNLRLMPTHYLLLSILLMLALHFLLPLRTILPLPWNLVGLIPLIVGVIFNLAADRDFHRAGTTVKPYEESATLLTEGVFRYSRNPMYMGFVFILIGIAILLRTLTPWLIIPFFVVLMDKIFIRVEEKMLEARFGTDWQSYRTKVKRWI